MKKTRQMQGEKNGNESQFHPMQKTAKHAFSGVQKMAITLRVNRLIDPHCQRGASTTPLSKGAQSIRAARTLQGLKPLCRVWEVGE